MSSLTQASPYSLDSTPPMRSLLAILGIALLLRIVWALIIPVVPESDVHAYDTFARNLARYGVFGWTKEEPFAFWAPGASFVYGLVYRVAGFDYVNVVIVNIAVSMGLILTSARVATRFYGERVGLWSAALLAVWPTLIMFTTLLVSELLFLFFVMAALDVWTARAGNVARGLVAGLLLGAATLVRPLAMLLPAIFAASMLLYMGLNRGNFVVQLRLAVLASIMLVCVLAPWAWRNYQLYGDVILVSTNGGVTLWMGNVPGSDGFMVPLPESVKGLNDNETNKVLGALAKQYILDDPLGFVWRSVRKLVLLYSNESTGALWNTGGITSRFGSEAVIWFKRFTQVTWAAIFLLAAAGALLATRKEGVWRFVTSPIGATLIYFSAVHSIIIVGDRYHLVVAPQLAMLGGYAIANLRRGEARSTGMLASSSGTGT